MAVGIQSVSIVFIGACWSATHKQTTVPTSFSTVVTSRNLLVRIWFPRKNRWDDVHQIKFIKNIYIYFMFFYIHQKCQASLLLTTAGSKRGTRGATWDGITRRSLAKQRLVFETVLRVFFLSIFFCRDVRNCPQTKILKMTSLRPTFFLMAICFIQKFSRTNLYEAVCRAGGWLVYWSPKS